ncbi:hypothetical protein Tco_1482854 [Tanacetum coccineum]
MVSQATISNTVKRSLEYLSLAPERGDVKRHKPAKFPDLEKFLLNGFFYIMKNVNMTDDEEEEEEEDPEIEEEMEEENDDDDDAEVFNPYEEADPLNLPPPDSDTESEDMVGFLPACILIVWYF